LLEAVVTRTLYETYRIILDAERISQKPILINHVRKLPPLEDPTGDTVRWFKVENYLTYVCQFSYPRDREVGDRLLDLYGLTTVLMNCAGVDYLDADPVIDDGDGWSTKFYLPPAKVDQPPLIEVKLTEFPLLGFSQHQVDINEAELNSAMNRFIVESVQETEEN
jgi:hypothetical protein